MESNVIFTLGQTLMPFSFGFKAEAEHSCELKWECKYESENDRLISLSNFHAKI